MRRRHHTEKMADDNQGLHESLLARERLLPEEDDEAFHGHPPSSQGQLIVYSGPFDVRAFIVAIVYKCAGTFTSCWQVLQVCYASLATWQLGRPQPLSLIQEERLEQLWVSLCQPYHPDDPSHQQALRDLWAHAFPDSACTALKSERWKDMGWQGDDPSTDIRGAGLFGVLNLLYLARQHPLEFDRLLHKRSGQRADWEYPFAAAGINLTFVLADLLGLKRSPQIAGDSRAAMPLDKMQKQPGFAGFVTLLNNEPYGFEELYVVAFRTLDDRWLRSGASYMQFNAVVKEVVADLTNALRSRPASFEHLSSLLGL